ncbi:hypothetical protein BAZMOX_458472_0 [methanotrophic endosymbiont of Bathymodiolus azoricus (Menez Gwen)]|jgi:hypothetical protein|nr:hypothetical protein BAZMOX_458472_0 [methanotrophic endosymbiont of Bathymodiolus azoricus (Menez Gwen)]
MSDYKSILHGFLENPVKFKTGKVGSNARAIGAPSYAENQGNGAIAK